MNLLRKTQRIQFREPRLLDSRTPGVTFEMTATAQWQARRTHHPHSQAIVRDTIVRRAQEIAITRYADDIYGTQDAINADLDATPPRNTRYYSRLTATVTLELRGDEAKADAKNYRHSVAHIERLHFLKEQLYSDPVILLLDYLDKNPNQLATPPDLAQFQKLALKVKGGEQWWCRVLDVLDKLSSQVSDQTGNFYVMRVLFAALQEAAPDLFNQQLFEEHTAHPSNPDSVGTG